MAKNNEVELYRAGETIIFEKQRAQSVRPKLDVSLQPVYENEGAFGGGGTEEAEGIKEVVPKEEPTKNQEGEQRVIDTDTRPVWEKMQDKVEESTDRVARYFDDTNEQIGRQPPIIKAPQQFTKREIEQHQTTHTPYADWCKHCMAARAIRRQHPKRGRGATIVSDIEGNIEGPIKVSIDYRYLHERTGKTSGTKIQSTISHSDRAPTRTLLGISSIK